MTHKFALLSLASVVIALSVRPSTARALHFDVMTQLVNGQLVTGTADWDHDVWTLGERVFHRGLDPTPAMNPTILESKDPGFTSIGDGSPDMPPGAQALPGSTPDSPILLSWDFLPMTIDGTSQNLFYWNGLRSDGQPGTTPDDVRFGPIPTPAYTLVLLDFNNGIHSVNGTNTIVPGGKIAKTAADGSIHEHLPFSLHDNDGNSSTLPVDGLYLIAMQLRMPGLATSLPVFMVFGTPGSSISAEDDAAVPWVEEQLDIPGDYNQNGVVDAADYTVWRDTLGQMGAGWPADGSGNLKVDQADYELWKMHFGEAAELIVGGGAGAGAVNFVAVPEGSAMGLALIAWCCVAVRMRAPLRWRSASRLNYGRGPRWERSQS